MGIDNYMKFNEAVDVEFGPGEPITADTKGIDKAITDAVKEAFPLTKFFKKFSAEFKSPPDVKVELIGSTYKVSVTSDDGSIKNVGTFPRNVIDGNLKNIKKLATILGKEEY